MSAQSNIRSFLAAVRFPAITAALLLLALVGCETEGAGPSGVGARAVAEMMSPEGDAMGTVVMEQGPNGVLVSADITGLEPGPHGFHIHETGSCSPDFAAAGDHFAPEGRAHGYMNASGDHAGDMPNIYAAGDGTARADAFNDAITLADGPDNSVMDADGSAIIIHEKGDTYGEDAGAGGRVACGVIALKLTTAP